MCPNYKPFADRPKKQKKAWPEDSGSFQVFHLKDTWLAKAP
jgi:hypothetical protein